MGDDLVEAVMDEIERRFAPGPISTERMLSEGIPWGWGALKGRGASDKWTCPECQQARRAGSGQHWMPDEVWICTWCAQQRCVRHGFEIPPDRRVSFKTCRVEVAR